MAAAVSLYTACEVAVPYTFIQPTVKFYSSPFIACKLCCSRGRMYQIKSWSSSKVVPTAANAGA
jgi:hypothetical protein